MDRVNTLIFMEFGRLQLPWFGEMAFEPCELGSRFRVLVVRALQTYDTSLVRRRESVVNASADPIPGSGESSARPSQAPPASVT